MADIIFKNYIPEIQSKLQHAAEAWLEEASGELETQVIRNTRVDTGRTKGSWNHKVDNGALEATVGSDYENAIWEEFGTGVYAESGGYRDQKGQWHKTKGKRGTRAFRKAYTSTKPKLIKAAQNRFRDALK